MAPPGTGLRHGALRFPFARTVPPRAHLSKGLVLHLRILDREEDRQQSAGLAAHADAEAHDAVFLFDPAAHPPQTLPQRAEAVQPVEGDLRTAARKRSPSMEWA